jgi:hypothetical protein
MGAFIKGILTDKDGSPSSKRVILFLLVITFLICVFVNLWSGKSLSSTLSEQLFYLVIYSLASVFGEGITSLFKKDKPTDQAVK